MQEDLSQLTNELKKETCPPRVLEEVERKIHAENVSVRTGARSIAPPASRRRWRLAIPFALAALALTCGLSIWRWQARENAQRQAALAKSIEQARVANQARDALSLMGSVISSAAADSEKIISDQAVPPLRNSLQTVTTKIIEPIEL